MSIGWPAWCSSRPTHYITRARALQGGAEIGPREEIRRAATRDSRGVCRNASRLFPRVGTAVLARETWTMVECSTRERSSSRGLPWSFEKGDDFVALSI